MSLRCPFKPTPEDMGPDVRGILIWTIFLFKGPLSGSMFIGEGVAVTSKPDHPTTPPRLPELNVGLRVGAAGGVPRLGADGQRLHQVRGRDEESAGLTRDASRWHQSPGFCGFVYGLAKRRWNSEKYFTQA